MSGKSPPIIGNSPALRKILARAKRVAGFPLSVLITGETGTGKELFARFIHDQSPRATKPFEALNCAAIPMELMESLLFGHEKGAFTGASVRKEGLFVQADGGTLFLDEIGDMPLDLQAKILRVIQEKEVRPVGARDIRKVDVRIVAATHRNLQKHVANGKFREDLLHRLRGYTLTLPPLRDRGRDIIVLARRFLEEIPEFRSKNLGMDAQTFLLQYSWPGNIRELRHGIQSAAVDAGRRIEARHIQTHLHGHGAGGNAEAEPKQLSERILECISEMEPVSLATIRARLQSPKTTVYRHLTRLESSGRIQRINGTGIVQFVTAGSLAASEVDLSTRQREAIRITRESGRITRRQFAEAVGISIRTAGRELADLVRHGTLISDGQSGKMSGYVLGHQ